MMRASRFLLAAVFFLAASQLFSRAHAAAYVDVDLTLSLSSATCVDNDTFYDAWAYRCDGNEGYDCFNVSYKFSSSHARCRARAFLASWC